MKLTVVMVITGSCVVEAHPIGCIMGKDYYETCFAKVRIKPVAVDRGAVMTHRPLVFLDIETTGGSPYDSRITEIGAIRVENGEVVGTFSQLINPEQKVPYFITKLTGITDDMLWDKPLFLGVADDLEKFLDGSIFVAHNVNFDYGFIKESYRRLNNGSSFNMDRFCTARLSRRLYPEQGRHNLDTIIAAHGIEVQDRHRALDDAKALHEFYKSALDQHGLRVYAAIDKIMTRTTTQTPSGRKI